MELQVPYNIYAEISKEGVFRRKTHRNKRDIKAVMPVEGSIDYRRGEVCPDHIHMLVSNNCMAGRPIKNTLVRCQ